MAVHAALDDMELQALAEDAGLTADSLVCQRLRRAIEALRAQMVVSLGVTRSDKTAISPPDAANPESPGQNSSEHHPLRKRYSLPNLHRPRDGQRPDTKSARLHHAFWMVTEDGVKVGEPIVDGKNIAHEDVRTPCRLV